MRCPSCKEDGVKSGADVCPYCGSAIERVNFFASTLGTGVVAFAIALVFGGSLTEAVEWALWGAGAGLLYWAFVPKG